MRDEAGFSAFVAARGPALLRLAWLLAADLDAAEDLLQEALARVVPRWDRVEPAAREAYVRTAIRSAWIDTWRRRAIRPLDVVPDLPEQAGPPGALEAAPSRVSLDAALALLTVRQRAVLVLRFYEDLTESQTAAAMGCTVSTVKSQTRHALERLRLLNPGLAEAFGRSTRSSGSAPSPSPAASSASSSSQPTSEVPS